MRPDPALNDDDVARLFRENDDIGPDSSLWLRPIRQLIRKGKPLGQMHVLSVSIEDGSFPFGVLTYTDANRLVFWPTLPVGTNMVCEGQITDIFDDITLEFPSEKTHITAYDFAGKAIRDRRSWIIGHSADSPLGLWFTILVRLAVLRQQDLAVQRKVPVPISDKDRRTNEMLRYVQHLKFVDIPAPTCPTPDYLYCSIYLAPDSITSGQIPPSLLLPADSSPDALIDGFPDKSECQIAVRRLAVDEKVIHVAAACPPGVLRGQVIVGFPRHRQ